MSSDPKDNDFWRKNLDQVRHYYSELLQNAVEAKDPTILAQRNTDDAKKFFNCLLDGIDLTGSLNILDIGCGTGNLLEYLNNRTNVGKIERYVGIDLLPEFIDQANMRFDDDGLNFVCGNFLEFPLESFEKSPLVLACGVLVHHVQDYENYLKIFIRRMMEVGRGVVVFNLITAVDTDSLNYDSTNIIGRPRTLDKTILDDILGSLENCSIRCCDHRIFPDAVDTFVQITLRE